MTEEDHTDHVHCTRCTGRVDKDAKIRTEENSFSRLRPDDADQQVTERLHRYECSNCGQQFQVVTDQVATPLDQ